MKILIRPLEKDQTDWETVAGLGIIPPFLLACFVLMKWFPGLLPRCRFHDLAGIPCPGCGGLKCAESLMNGRLPEAFLAQPMGCVAIVAGVAFSLYSALVLAFRLPRLRLTASAGEWKAVVLVAAAAALANWAYLILAGD